MRLDIVVPRVKRGELLGVGTVEPVGDALWWRSSGWIPWRSRSSLRTDWGDVVFVVRDVSVLEVQRADTDLVTGWVTTIEQTLLDIADCPTLGGIDPRAASEVIAALAPRAEWDAVADLARRQRRRAAYARARWVADPVIDAGASMPVVPSHRDRYADPRGDAHDRALHGDAAD